VDCFDVADDWYKVGDGVDSLLDIHILGSNDRFLRGFSDRFRYQYCPKDFCLIAFCTLRVMTIQQK
uniref:hypothetical protein n=1 Tax=Lysinibacillus odysseyi TaxID=202611 RepID=UPI00055C6C7A